MILSEKDPAMLRPFVHMGLHFIVPVLAARLGWKPQWPKAALIMVMTMIVDLDHLLAIPVYDPSRCSIGFHPLHSIWAVGFYASLLTFRWTRLWGAGLLIHMMLDLIDCLWMRAWP
jgi:hypothetical protein